MKMRKWLSVFLILAMTLGMMPFSAYAADTAGTAQSLQFSDMPDNWSTAVLQNAVANGLLTGADGKIMPDSPLTRAQMAAVITRAFKASVKGDISGFSDVKPTDWFYDSMAKAYQMKVINGSGGYMNPNASITREEVFVILARAFKLQPADRMDKTFSDADAISSWAKGEVYAIVNAGYVNGSGGMLNPKSQITRAEFAQIFDNILKEYISKAGVVTAINDGNIMVNVPGVTLKDLTVKGDLIIGDGVGDGEVILDNVIVTGRMVVRGGGVNSIIIRGSSNVGSVVVSRVDGEVRIDVQGDANVEVIYVDDGSDDVIVEGTVGNIEVQASGITVTASGATIGTLNVSGENTNIVVNSGSSIGTVTTSGANTQITGSGTVTKVEAQPGANGTKIETPNTQIVVGSGVTGVTGGGGTAIEGGSTVNNNSSGTGTTTGTAGGGGGGGGGGSLTQVQLSNANVVTESKISFYCDTAGASIKWNGTLLSAITGTGTNTITVPLMDSGFLNTLEVLKTGYESNTITGIIYIAPYDSTAVLGDWDDDRTPPDDFDISDDDWITITASATQNPNSWYDYQGKKAPANVGLTENWMMETKLDITEDMLTGTNSIATSVWLQVDGSVNFNAPNEAGYIDWPVLQFKKDSAGSAKWQAWNEAEDRWDDLTTAPITAGIHTLIMTYEEGTIRQYIDGILVNFYDVNTDDGLSAPTNVFIQVFTFGQVYSAQWKLPEISYEHQYDLEANIVSTPAELIQAVNDLVPPADPIYIAKGTYNLTEQLNITKPMAIVGLGQVTLKAVPAGSWPTDNEHKHLLTVYGGDIHEIHIANITFDSDRKAYGLQAYGEALLSLDKVNIINSKGAGLTVNGSEVSMTHSCMNGNDWGSINVDPGDGVETPSVLTVDNASELLDAVQIWSDGAHVDELPGATVEVNVDDSIYTQYKAENYANFYLWANKPLSNVATITKDGVTKLYLTLPEALAAAEDGDTINVAAGTYELPAQLLIDKPVSITGAGAATVIKPASDFDEGTYDADKHLISIEGVVDTILLSNLTVCDSLRSGINVFESADVTLENIDSRNNAGAGLIVNNSKVSANNLSTSGNGWGYGINVDNGSSPSPDAPATEFTLTGSGILAEAYKIVSDAYDDTITVNAAGYTAYRNSGSTVTFWTDEEPEDMATITTDGVAIIYATVSAAVTAASDEDTINVAAGTYDEIVSVSGKSLTIIGADRTGTKIKAISCYPGAGNALTIRNLTVCGNNGSGQSFAGIYIANGTVTVEDCDIKAGVGADNTKHSILTETGNAAIISITGCGFSGYKAPYFNPATGTLLLDGNDFNGRGPSIDPPLPEADPPYGNITITDNTGVSMGVFIGYGLLEESDEAVLATLSDTLKAWIIEIHENNPGAVVKLSTNKVSGEWGGFNTDVEDGELVITGQYIS